MFAVDSKRKTRARVMRCIAACWALGCAGEPPDEAAAELGVRQGDFARGELDELPNDFPFPNPSGAAATFSSDGFVDLSNPFHVPQGENGRACDTCHLPQTGWSVVPVEVELRFWLTRGTDPIFNLLDADSPNADVSTPHARYAAYSMLRRGLFRRGGNVPAGAEFEITEFDDPLGAGASLTRFQFFRRPLATANFHIARNVGWHDQNANGSGDVRAGLLNQATGNITGGQQGPTPEPETVNSIADYELSLSFAQSHVFGIGDLRACGGRGGPELLSAEQPRSGRFDLFDAWIGLEPGTCGSVAADRRRARIARGQELFNEPDAAGRSCLSCHDAANNGSNVAGILFDIGVSSAALRAPGMPLYTVRNLTTGETRQTTDPGRAVRSGRWADLDAFKVPSLRGIAARAPYFHNGSAATLRDVIRHYEVALGFDFSDREEADLVAFLSAL